MSKVIRGNAADVLATLPEKSVHCAVTSPPYFGLRDYGAPGQLGLEKTPEEYTAALVNVFRGVRRVLRDDGTLWLNLGDSYGAKNLLMIPARVALALQADGWYLRADIIWHKPNPMPSSVRDRPTSSHEHLFLFTKRPRYFYDGWRSPRLDVWTIPVGRYKGAHFAVFPPALVRPCVLAGTSAKGCCPECGSPWQRIVKRYRYATRPAKTGKMCDGGTLLDDAALHGNRDPERHCTLAVSRGWEPGCKCGVRKRRTCTVLDPFGGSGTTGAVAAELGRDAVLVELNPDYCGLIEGRLSA